MCNHFSGTFIKCKTKSHRKATHDCRLKLKDKDWSKKDNAQANHKQMTSNHQNSIGQR